VFEPKTHLLLHITYGVIAQGTNSFTEEVKNLKLYICHRYYESLLQQLILFIHFMDTGMAK
jgi:hypothetical protein